MIKKQINRDYFQQDPLLIELFERALAARGDIRDKKSDKFRLTAELYRALYNSFGLKTLTAQLKIPNETARRIHKQAWGSVNFSDDKLSAKEFLNSYTQHLADLANEYIKNTYDDAKQRGKRLKECILSELDKSEAGDKLSIIKERWAFLWRFISEMEDMPKRIFTYRVYCDMSFADIAKILNTAEHEVRKIYIKSEDELFNSEEFKQFFVLKKEIRIVLKKRDKNCIEKRDMNCIEKIVMRKEI